MGSIDFLIFSKNRPLQLEGLLKSFFHFLDNSKIKRVSVLYKAEFGYQEAYETLESNFPEVFWQREIDFKRQVLEFSFSSTDFVCFLVDDIIFYQPVQGDITPKETEICFSLRLGKNCKFCHPANSFYRQPEFITEGEFVSWYWKGAEFDFGYPMSLDGHIFRKDVLNIMLQNFEFRNPNSLENGLTYYNPILSNFSETKMRSFGSSRLVGIPINRVNTEIQNRFGLEFPISENELLEKFNQGERIYWQGMDFTQIIGPHQELVLNLK